MKEKAGERAMFVHCHAHILNLVVCDSAEVSTTARDMFAVLKRLYAFFPRHQSAMVSMKETFSNFAMAWKDGNCCNCHQLPDGQRDLISWRPSITACLPLLHLS
jgi:hypothetical protein